MPPTAATRRLDHEHTPRLHGDRADVVQRLHRAVGPFDPVDAGRAGLATGRFSLGGVTGGAADGSFSAAVVNQGELRSTNGGRLLLIGGAGGVRNDGLIEAPDGQVVLAAGTQVDLVDTATPRLGLQLRAPQGEVLNLGRLSAGSGFIDLQAALVNQQGIVRADSLGTGAGGQVLLDKGLSNRDIAENLQISEHTVKVHLWRLFRRLSVKSRSQASHLARTQGLL